jgi:hypothetical protein
MRNREAALRKIDQIDSSLNKVINLLKRNDEQRWRYKHKIKHLKK